MLCPSQGRMGGVGLGFGGFHVREMGEGGRKRKKPTTKLRLHSRIHPLLYSLQASIASNRDPSFRVFNRAGGRSAMTMRQI